MRRDNELQQLILSELKWEPSINAAQIGVGVKDGVVTLSGAVDTFAQKFAAERAAERIAGVRAIADELAVVTTGDYKKTDADIARAAANAILWDVEVPTEKVKVIVQDGWVTLEGNVDWYYQKASAERAVRYLAGVKGVTNRVNIQPPRAKVADIKTEIESAFKRHAELDARKIQVETVEGKVTLNGTVRSWAEREDAERAAWCAPGVSQVNDHLSVSM